MVDQESGMEVPIIAVTKHPQTGEWLNLGGTYLHPLTGLISPIELGGPMIDATGGNIFPILGVELHSTTGDVVPLGGLLDSCGNISVLGDVFCEPLSRKKTRIQGAVPHQEKLVPHAGSYQALLQSNLLISQLSVINALKAHKDLFAEDLPVVTDDRAHTLLNDAVQNMKKSASIIKRQMMYQMYNISQQKKMAADIKCSGGNLGMIMYPRTELWIPALLGIEIPDPGPSDLMVPILGIEHDFNKGHLIPLAGTMEHPGGKGLIPISVGSRTIDPVSGDCGPVIGAQIDPVTGIVTPIVQSLGPVKEKDFCLLEVLEKELTSRERFWQTQKTKEEELIKDLSDLIVYILVVAREEKTHKISCKDRIVSVEETCQSLEESSLFETQRRTNTNLSSLLLKSRQLPFLDDGTEEKEHQLTFLLVVRKTLEKLTQFTEKMDQEAERLCKQMREWSNSREQNAEEIVKAKHRKIMVHLVDQFEEHMMKRLAGVDAAYCRVDYVRDHTRLQGLQAKSYLLGTTPHYINSQSAYWKITGKETKEIGQLLIPTMKHLIQVLEDNKNTLLPSTDIEAPGSGYSSRSTLKASAAHSEKCQQLQNKRPTHAPLFSNAEIFFRHQGYLLRFLLEKQASELVHLDHLLMAEEIHRIWEFYDCYKVLSKGNLKENLTNLIEGSHNKDKPDIKQKLCSGQNDMCWEWAKLQEDLVIMHKTAHQTLKQKHQEEVKTLCLDAGAVIPGNYLYRDTEGAIVQLARDMQTVYVCDAQVEASSVEVPVRSDDKDNQDTLLRTIAGKLVRQELLMQIRTYTLLDAYNRLQVDNCVGEVQKILKNIQSCSGKAAAEETAKAMEQRQIEKLVAFFKKSHNEEEMQGVQLSLSDMKQQIKEEHYTLTEQLLQVKDKILLQELMKSGSRNMDHVVCCVLSQTHLRQMVVLLQQAFKAQTHNKETLSHGTRLYEDTMGHCQEDILNLLKNKSEAIELLLDLHHIVQKMQLREHQLEEIASGLKEYCCDKVHILSCVEEALYLATELRTFREQKLKQLREDLNYICEASKKPKSLSLVPNEEKATEDTTFIKDFQEKQAELEQVYRKQMSEERLKLQDQLERGELSGLLKQKLIKEHDETVALLEKTLQRDLDKLSIKLEEEQKRKKTFIKSVSSTSGRLSAQCSAEQDILTLLTESAYSPGVNNKLIKEHDETVALLEKTLQRDLDKLSIKLEEEQKRKKTFIKSVSSTSGRLSAQCSAEQDILTLLTENIRVLQQAEQVTALRITYLASQPFSCNFPDQETAKIVESSPILNLLKDVDSQLRTNATNAKILQEKSSREIDKGNKFRDLMDLQLTNKGELTIVHLAELTAREFVVYQYGIYILQLLTSHNYTPEINLHIASCIPESSYRGNGFRNSFFYQNSERCLFVSREYLQSDGSFILLLVHCISHIVVQDLRDDTNPTFLRTFYQALKICLSDGFFSSISQDATTSLPLQDLFLNRESFLTKQSDLTSHLLRMKMNSARCFTDPLKKAREMLSQHNIELLLQNKLSMKKRKSFMLSFMGNSRHVNNEPGTKLHFKDCVSIEDLEEELDQLNSELANILEKEMESQIDYNDEGICSLQMMSLEKECLRTKIQYLEDKITEQNMV